MFGKILEKFGNSEPLELEDISSADRVLKEEKEKSLEKVERKSEKFQEDIEQVLEEVDDEISDLEGFEDSKDRTVIEDVIGNIVEDRKKLVEEFSVEDSPQELHSELQRFLTEFRSMSQKEAAVMEEVYLKDKFSSVLGKVESRREKLESFLQNEHKTRERVYNLRELIEEKEDLEGELEGVKEELENIEPEDLEKNIEVIEDRLEELRKSEERKEYEELGEKLEEKKTEKESAEKSIGKAMSKMERGLKKLLYEGSVKVSKEKGEILREIRDGEKEKLMEREPEKVEDAVRATCETEEDVLEGSTRKKLLEGATNLEDFSSINERISSRQEEIEELKEKLEGHGAVEKEGSLEDRKEELEDKMWETKKKNERLEERKEEIISEIEAIEDEILETMEEELGREVNIVSN